MPTLFGVFGLSALLPDGPAKRREVDEFLAGVRSGDRLRKASPGASRDAGAALSIIGLCTGLIGLLLALAVAVTGHARDGLYSIVVGLVLALLGFVAWRYGKRAALSS
ncbi:MAG: hypothetical protein ACOX5J_18270 [Candidatus Hydrogenedentales bacterium]